MSDETERAWWSNALAAANAERDEALGLLRDWVEGPDVNMGMRAFDEWEQNSFVEWEQNLWTRAQALVERAGPAGAHPAGSED